MLVSLKFRTLRPMLLVMESVAGRRTWTREALVELFGPGPVSCRDASARVLPQPPVLSNGRGLEEEVPETWTEFFVPVFSDDRADLSRAWRSTIARPGEPIRARFRERRSFAWWECQITYLNLLEQPEFGVVLCAERDVGAVEAPVPRQTEADASSTSSPLWLLQHLNELGTVLRCEGFSQAMLGLDPSETIGTENLSLIHPDDQGMVVTTWLELLAEPGATRTMKMRMRHPEHGYRWYESMTTNRLAEPGIEAMVSISYDIEVRRRKEAAIYASEQQFRTLAEEIPVAVFRADADGRVTYANDLFHRTVGDVDHLRSLPAAVGAWWDSVLSGDHSEEVVFELGRRTMRIRGRAQRAPGDAVPGGDEGFQDGPDASLDATGTIEAVIGSVEDVTASVVRERHLHELAHSDPLTGLANRRVLEQVIEGALLAHEPIVVIEADLDGFKALNDAAGHHVGDLVLIEVARRLNAAVRPDDLVTRVGGDEFIVVCRSVGDDSVTDLVARVRQAICEPIAAADDVSVDVSIGSARAQIEDDLHALLRRADLAMYDDKRHRGHRR